MWRCQPWPCRAWCSQHSWGSFPRNWVGSFPGCSLVNLQAANLHARYSNRVGIREGKFWPGKTGEVFRLELLAVKTTDCLQKRGFAVWLLHLLTVWPWARHLVALPLLCVLCKSGHHHTYFLGYLWRLYGVIHINDLAQCFAQSEHSGYGGLTLSSYSLFNISQDLLNVFSCLVLDHSYEQENCRLPRALFSGGRQTINNIYNNFWWWGVLCMQIMNG